MAKASDAFRTIGEVSDELDVPKHVLRFWEGKFPQLKPMKRGGGRRFYRPEDVTLLRGIHHLLHGAGYTIKGVQRILRESGVEAVKNATGGGAPSRQELAAPNSPTAAAGQAPKRSNSKRGAVPTSTGLMMHAGLKERLAEILSELEACLAIGRGAAEKSATGRGPVRSAKSNR